MKIKMRSLAAGVDASGQSIVRRPGSIHEVSDLEAAALIKSGSAESLDVKPKAGRKGREKQNPAETEGSGEPAEGSESPTVE